MYPITPQILEVIVLSAFTRYVLYNRGFHSVVYDQWQV